MQIQEQLKHLDKATEILKRTVGTLRHVMHVWLGTSLLMKIISASAIVLSRLLAGTCVTNAMQIDTGKIDEAVAAMLGNHASMNVDNLYSALMAKTPK
jgi:hypothetical protein